MSEKCGKSDAKIVANIVRISPSNAIFGGLESEIENFENSSNILRCTCTTYKKFLLLDRVPLR